jgi:hypothetical protein
MHVHRATFAVCAALLAASCGSPSGPTAQAPDVRGVWSGGNRSWGWSMTSAVRPGQSVESSACEGTLTITEQDGGSFGGRYSINCTGAGRSSGAIVDGRVGEHGDLSFRLQADQGWAPGLLPGRLSPPCPVTRDAEAYTGGIFNDSRLSVDRVQTLGCDPDPVIITASFQGARG